MIGGTLEYLMSSLPNLTFENTDEAQRRVLGLLRSYAGATADNASPAQLLDSEARKFLSVPDFSVFQKMSLKNIHQATFRKRQNKVLAAYSAFALDLRIASKEWRMQAGASDKQASQHRLAAIIGTGNPLEKEVRLMKYQWDTLEELSIGHFADLEALFTYKIKLLILQRWWSFDREKGFKRFLKMTQNK